MSTAIPSLLDVINNFGKYKENKIIEINYSDVEKFLEMEENEIRREIESFSEKVSPYITVKPLGNSFIEKCCSLMLLYLVYIEYKPMERNEFITFLAWKGYYWSDMREYYEMEGKKVIETYLRLLIDKEGRKAYFLLNMKSNTNISTTTIIQKLRTYLINYFEIKDVAIYEDSEYGEVEDFIREDTNEYIEYYFPCKIIKNFVNFSSNFKEITVYPQNTPLKIKVRSANGAYNIRLYYKDIREWLLQLIIANEMK